MDLRLIETNRCKCRSILIQFQRQFPYSSIIDSINAIEAEYTKVWINSYLVFMIKHIDTKTIYLDNDHNIQAV